MLRVHLPSLQPLACPSLAKSDCVLSLEYSQDLLRDFPKHPYAFCTQRHIMTKSMRQLAFLLVFTNEVLVPIFSFRAYPKKGHVPKDGLSLQSAGENFCWDGIVAGSHPSAVWRLHSIIFCPQDSRREENNWASLKQLFKDVKQREKASAQKHTQCQEESYSPWTLSTM